MTSNVDTAKRYLFALEAGVSGDALMNEFFTSDVVITELPNRFTPNGATRNLDDARAASERGKTVMRTQRYDIRSITAQDNRVAIEFQWTGTLAVAVGSLPVGGAMRAHVATVLEFRDGKIAAQRHYDCYEPF